MWTIVSVSKLHSHSLDVYEQVTDTHFCDQIFDIKRQIPFLQHATALLYILFQEEKEANARIKEQLQNTSSHRPDSPSKVSVYILWRCHQVAHSCAGFLFFIKCVIATDASKHPLHMTHVSQHKKSS